MTLTEHPRTHQTRWDHHYELLLDYTSRHGTALVPSTYRETINGRSVPLGAWVAAQRRRGRAGLLPASRATKLAGLPNWQWGPLRPGPNAHDERNAQIKELREQGVSLEVIGERYGLTRQRIHQILTTGR